MEVSCVANILEKRAPSSLSKQAGRGRIQQTHDVGGGGLLPGLGQ